MNERIKELWSEAAKLETDDSWEGQTRFMEKFAELIVKECIDVVKWTPSIFTNDTIIENLKKHFGVKE